MHSCTLNKLFDLLAVGEGRERTERLVGTHRHCRNGLLSVGLKLHVLPGAFDSFQELLMGLGLGSAASLSSQNLYRHEAAACTMVLPPVGSAEAAIELLELIGMRIGQSVFCNSQILVQVCSPGRLQVKGAALLGCGFFLSSELLRKYTTAQFRTTISNDGYYKRGTRLILYDAYNVIGDFDDAFEWWEYRSGKLRVTTRLPFSRERTDVQVGIINKRDIENINLIASLLVHNEKGGYWDEFGRTFSLQLQELLMEYQMGAVLACPWVATYGDQHHVPTEDVHEADAQFIGAIRDLMTVASDECSRARGPEAKPGILEHMQELMNEYRQIVHARHHWSIGGGLW